MEVTVRRDRGPPKRPHGGSPAFATRPSDGGELAPGVQYRVPTVSETDKDMSDRAATKYHQRYSELGGYSADGHRMTGLPTLI